MVTHTLIDFADVVVVGASPHPSITIEAMFFKRDVVTLVSQIKRPMLLLPAGRVERSQAVVTLSPFVFAHDFSAQTVICFCATLRTLFFFFFLK